MQDMHRVYGFIAAAGVVAVVAVGASYSPIETNQLITGCYNKTNGSLRLIDVAVGSCNQSAEVTISWNREGLMGPVGLQGPQGPIGLPGPQGPAGPSVAVGTGSLTVPIMSVASGQEATLLIVGPLMVIGTCSSGANQGQVTATLWLSTTEDGSSYAN